MNIEQLFPGAIVYNPDYIVLSDESDGYIIPLGSIGIFLSTGESCTKFEPINVLFCNKIIHVYIDEIEFA